MSEESTHIVSSNGQDDYIEATEVAEEVAPITDDAPEPVDDDSDAEMVDEDEAGEYDAEGNLTIDMSNNSWGYFDQHSDSIFTVFTHPTLPLAVTGGGDNTAYMWTTHKQPPQMVTELKGHKESVICGGFTFDGEFAVTGDMNGKILIHQLAKKGQQWQLFAELEEVEEVCWIVTHPTQPVFAFGAADGSVWVYQITPQLEQIMSGFSHQDVCNGGRFVNVEDLDSLTLVTISEDGSIVSWNCFTAQTNYKIGPTELKGTSPPWVSISLHNSQNNIMAVGSRDGQLAIVNSTNGTILTFFKVIVLKEDQDESEASIEALSWCDVQPIITVGLVSGDVMLLDTKTWRARRTISVDDTITKLQFVANSPLLIGSSMNGKIYKWDSRTGEELFVGVGHNMGILDFAVIEGGKKLLTAGDEGVSLVFYNE
ncbi:hypothetical protein BABINDRAFT_166866 [Babjeviella inositovora NRRL Y-12698]|uniref:Uncharacterized protein n=1 Tax=Babjeviella inositovora NRRL Y-12698 TaxID=984486 RepID=A0A1E3QQ38_9ASCO|nr:uncharacterized protein BABINDRAFT_166866 [Babjeviella inositovora NRRL Y-12698]ODQ79758.1 hypothetical protein BABINDRAFT_166866 [Babjeviella inositovora NRRL Y-12698]